VERYRLIDYEVAKEALERNAKENFRFPPGVQPFDFDPEYRGKHPEFIVEDEGAFTRPWFATVTYARPNVVFPSAWFEFISAENPREYPTGQTQNCPTPTSRISDASLRFILPFSAAVARRATLPIALAFVVGLLPSLHSDNSLDTNPPSASRATRT
jgi:hypothetical protein